MQVSFNWPGFISAMGSNLTFQSRNVFSKKFMTPEIKEKVRCSSRHFSLPCDERRREPSLWPLLALKISSLFSTSPRSDLP